MVKDICEINSINQKSVEYVKKHMISGNSLSSIVDKLKILNDPSRLKILNALSIKELCVCDIACLLNTTQSAVSHQLRLLRHAKFVKYRKDGKMAYYSLADKNIVNILKMVIDNVQ